MITLSVITLRLPLHLLFVIHHVLTKQLRMRDSYTNPYESKRVIWDFCFHKTNPRNESLRFGFANPDSRIQSTRIRKDSDSRISIFKDLFCAIVLRIHKDLLDSWKQVKSLENWLDSWSRYEPNLFKLGFVIHDTNQIFLSPDLWPTNRYESMDSRNESMFLRISYTNPASLKQPIWFFDSNQKIKNEIISQFNEFIVAIQNNYQHWYEREGVNFSLGYRFDRKVGIGYRTDGFGYPSWESLFYIISDSGLFILPSNIDTYAA